MSGTAAAAPLAGVHRGRKYSASQELVAPGPAAAVAAAAKLSQLSQLPHSRWTDDWLADRLEGLPCNQSGYCRRAPPKKLHQESYHHQDVRAELSVLN